MTRRELAEGIAFGVVLGVLIVGALLAAPYIAAAFAQFEGYGR